MNEDVGSGTEVIDSAVQQQVQGLRTAKWVYDLIPSSARKDVSKIMLDIKVGAGIELLQPGRVAGVLLVILSGTVEFRGDAMKKTRDGGIWRESGLGELCSDTFLQAGDVVALGRPGDECMLSAFHSTSASAEGKLRCLGGTHHHTTLTTKDAVHYIALPLQELIFMIGPHAGIIASPEGRRALLLNMPWTTGLSKKEVDALSFACKPGMYAKGDVLITQGETPKYVALLVSGSVSIMRKTDGRDSQLYQALSGDVLGERELAMNRSSPSSAVADSDAFCLLIDANDYATLAPSRKQLACGRLWPLAMRDEHEHQQSKDIKKLTIKAIVGAGAFAQVALVRHPDGQMYALKKMNRAHLEGEKVMKQVMNERFVLALVSHNGIAQLKGTYKSKISLYMLLEPCMGGELFSQMRKLRRLDEDVARFYSACVISAFEYMQAKGVLYRDLKPENVMIAADGYIKIVDFGFAKRVFTRTYTVCGTPEYLAPELLMMKGHGHGVDWWALGVLLYEMVVGVAPFCFHPETKKPDADLPPPDLYKNILNPKYELPFPSRLSSGICEMVEQLLAWDPLTRLGCLTDGAMGIKRLEFFKDFDWEKLDKQQLKPPFVPSLNGDDDTGNFEEADESRANKFTDEPSYEHKGAWDADF